MGMMSKAAMMRAVQMSYARRLPGGTLAFVFSLTVHTKGSMKLPLLSSWQTRLTRLGLIHVRTRVLPAATRVGPMSVRVSMVTLALGRNAQMLTNVRMTPATTRARSAPTSLGPTPVPVGLGSQPKTMVLVRMSMSVLWLEHAIPTPVASTGLEATNARAMRDF